MYMRCKKSLYRVLSLNSHRVYDFYRVEVCAVYDTREKELKPRGRAGPRLPLFLFTTIYMYIGRYPFH